jgi:hypothetical protein
MTAAPDPISKSAANPNGPNSSVAGAKGSVSPASAPTQPAASAPSSQPVAQTEIVDPEAMLISRQQPIPPPSERLQYRAIGLIRGRYQPAEDCFNRGSLVTNDGTELDAVLLGQVMSLVKKHLDLEQEHLWVVYPRTREKQRSLHVQVLGVWEPEQLHPLMSDAETTEPPTDGYFSIRGEIIFQSPEKGFVVVKIQQSPRKGADGGKSFKLRLEGTVPMKAPGYFWEVEARRDNSQLIVVNAQSVALLPPKKGGLKKAKPKGGPRPARPGRPGERAYRPMDKAAGDRTPPAPASPERRQPLSKPVKRVNRSEG